MFNLPENAGPHCNYESIGRAGAGVRKCRNLIDLCK